MAEKGGTKKIFMQEKENSRNQTIEQTIKETVNLCKNIFIASLIAFFLLLFARMFLIKETGLVTIIGGVIWIIGYPIFSLLIVNLGIGFVSKIYFKSKLRSDSLTLLLILIGIISLIMILFSVTQIAISFIPRADPPFKILFFIINLNLTFIYLLIFLFIFMLPKLKHLISRQDEIRLIIIGTLIFIICINSLFYYDSFIFQISLVNIFVIGILFLITSLLINKYDKIQNSLSNKI
jgi:hypothetical protein